LTWGRDSRPAAAAESRPKLVVVCVFDQMRGDYLDRFDAAFGDGGFRRVKREGTHFTNCHYPYAETETGPGHASLASGRLPRHTGITSNEWFDKEQSKIVYCVEDPSVKLLGPGGPVEGTGMSAKNLLGETLSDVVRAESAGLSRVFSISHKDRSAIPMGGHRPNVALWFLPQAGSYGTSSYFAASTPEWLSTFSKSRSLEQMPRTWERALPEQAYAHLGPDSRPWERPRAGMGNVFPHPLFVRSTALEQWEAVYNAPTWMSTLTDLAFEILGRERLGRGEQTDLLWISYSATDLCGHYFGPGSHELFDAYARADRELERLLTGLDAAMGKGNYVFSLTSDHGVCEVPERELEAGRDAGRLSLGTDSQGKPAGFLAEIETAFSTRVGKQPRRRWAKYVTASSFTFSRSELDAAGLDEDDACKALRDVLRQNPRIAAAYTQKEVERKKDDVKSPFLRAFYNSNFGARCGEVFFVLKPGWLATTTPATHGTPHPYDTFVPLLLMGPGVPKGSLDASPVTPLDLTPTLARILGIRAPEGCDGSVLPWFRR
jgi:hypothetical protein